ncbi:MAG TPA: GNAT family N-acetyltransferase [Actinocrinis sp.]|nr:GNAT family N-acetyltransferase [Actinocrinis sp.]
MTSPGVDETTALLARIEQYYDALPRHSARAEDFGPLVLFVRESRGWPYYARPAAGRAGPVGPGDVDRVRERQRELGIPETFEWVDELNPQLRASAEKSGLTVHEHPLMALDPGAELPADRSADGLAVRIVGPDDPALPSALAVPRLAFAEPGTGIGAGGRADLEQMLSAKAHDGSVAHVVARMQAGWTVVAAAVDDGTALSAGQHQPIGRVSEIVGVGTLPTARRRGLGRAVTAALAADARTGGVDTVFLSADDEDVARIYAGLGFRRIATALIADAPPAIRE